MTEHATPAEIAVAYLEAFGSHDMSAAARYIAEDIVFESPRVKLTGAESYLAAVGEFAQVVTGIDIISVLGDDERAMVLYDMKTGPFGTLRASDSFVVRDGKITSDVLVFDTYEVRKAGLAMEPSTATVVRYETRAEAAQANQRSVEEVFAQLNAEDPGGLRYVTFRLADEVSFVHVAIVEGEPNPLSESSAFAAFQEGLGDRLVAPPVRAEASVVGSYRFLER